MGSLGNRREREVEEEEEEAMEVGPERSRPLHNFKMPRLKWGNQKFLRCMNEIPKGGSGILSAAADRRVSVLGVEKGLIGGRREAEHVRRGRIERIVRTESFMKSPAVAAAGVGGKSQAEGDGIEAVRAKLLFDLQAAADKMKDAILREGLEEEETMPSPAADPAPGETDDAVRPWNLRTRRAACKAPNGMNGVIGSGGSGSGSGGGTVNGGVVRKPNFSPVRNGSKSPPNFPAAAEEKRERLRFSVPLSRREIEEDCREMTGHRPPRRPKKRPKIVQKQLDTLFPGLWLTEVTADMYKVPDAPETEKR